MTRDWNLMLFKMQLNTHPSWLVQKKVFNNLDWNFNYIFVNYIIFFITNSFQYLLFFQMGKYCFVLKSIQSFLLTFMLWWTCLPQCKCTKKTSKRLQKKLPRRYERIQTISDLDLEASGTNQDHHLEHVIL